MFNKNINKKNKEIKEAIDRIKYNKYNKTINKIKQEKELKEIIEELKGKAIYNPPTYNFLTLYFKGEMSLKLTLAKLSLFLINENIRLNKECIDLTNKKCYIFNIKELFKQISKK